MKTHWIGAFTRKPLACPACGPALNFRQAGSDDINDNETAS